MEIRIKFSASKAGQCRRRYQLEYQGVQGLPLWEGSERAFAEGRMHEQHILAWAAENIMDGGWHIRARQKYVLIYLEEIFSIDGHIDGEIFARGRGRYLIEAKALSRMGFHELMRQGVARAHPQYYAQIQLYLHGLQAYPHSKTEMAYLVARNKETPRSRMWDHYVEQIVYDPEFVAHEINDLRSLAERILGGEDIPPTFNPEEDWQCRPPWCPYTYICYPDYRRPTELVKDAGDLEEMIERRQQLSEEIAALKEEHDGITEAIKASLEDGEYTAGPWRISLSTSRVERVDTKAVREKVDPQLLPSLIKISEQRVLRVKAMQEVE